MKIIHNSKPRRFKKFKSNGLSLKIPQKPRPWYEAVKASDLKVLRTHRDYAADMEIVVLKVLDNTVRISLDPYEIGMEASRTHQSFGTAKGALSIEKLRKGDFKEL